METVKFICFFLVCQYYSKQALGFLENKKKWVSLLKIVMYVGVAFAIVGAVFIFLDGILVPDASALCKKPSFLLLRGGGEVVVLFFLAIGIGLTR